jgi:putative hydrolase of the HAD superfamily
MIEAILFDFDGVIRQWDESDLWTFETEANIERGTVFAVAFSKELHAPLTRGELTWAQWKDETERILVESHGAFIRPIVRRFFAFEGRIDLDMVKLIKQLPKNLRLGILTNNHDRFEEYLQRVGVAELFDAVINTHRIGVAKPEKLAYEKAVSRLSVEPENCLFVDDVEGNVDGGEAAGLKCHHFQNQTGLVEFLKKFDIQLISDSK